MKLSATESYLLWLFNKLLAVERLDRFTKMGNKEKTDKKSGALMKSQKGKGKRKYSKIDKETNKQMDKVEGVRILVSKYGMTNIEALIEYDKFFKKYPSGLINKEQFLEEYKVSSILHGSILIHNFFPG